MMRILRCAMIAIALVSASAAGFAHSLDEVQRDLVGKDPNFQPVDRRAPDFTLQDADGRVVRLPDLRGKIVVLNFIYTNCPNVCPMHSERIAQVQALINGTAMKSRVEFVTITTDPKRDTGQVLKDYGNAHGLNPVNWMFLTAAPDQPEDSTRKIAEAYGVTFSPPSDGRAPVHGIFTYMIDQDSRIRAHFHGLTFAPTDLVTFVNALADGLQKPHEEPSFWVKVRGFL